ncbi:MAG: succinate dehydrogenase cytochrome b subunit [Acidobacteria bacterium]|nr:succinate dehydrogenase cytochrome b subunit [Acidobacteriota bacterium]
MSVRVQSLGQTSVNPLLRLWHSSVGKKYVMAITGLGLFGFVIIHMAGNLQIFLGADQINTYAYTLKSMPLLLWSLRLGLLAIFIFHITAAIQLAAGNRRARPTGYKKYQVVASSFSSRTILISGLTIFAFVVFHLAHFTFGFVDPNYLGLTDARGRHDVYRMMVEGFTNPLVSSFYIVSMGLLLLHLSHGVSSIFQSLGLRSKRTFRFFDGSARLAALAIFLGNCAIPLAILLGWIS